MPASPEQREHAVERAAKIFTLIKQAAERGERCPKNAVLRQRFGCSDHAISNALHFLEANGMIRVERGNDHRVVLITATGKRTAGTVKNTHWSATPSSGAPAATAGGEPHAPPASLFAPVHSTSSSAEARHDHA